MTSERRLPGRAWSMVGRLTLLYGISGLLLGAIVSGALYAGLARELDRQDRRLVASKVRVQPSEVHVWISINEALDLFDALLERASHLSVHARRTSAEHHQLA